MEKREEEIAVMAKKWEEECAKAIPQKMSGRERRFVTDNGLSLKPGYAPRDLTGSNFDFANDLGFPGQYPFTRGITALMYRTDPWVIGVYSGFGEAGICNQRYRKLVEWGVEEIAIAADLPTQVGYDSDDIMSRGEVGKVGVAIDSLRDLEILFDGIPLNTLKRVGILGNSFGPIACALLIALGEKQGLKPSEFCAEFQNDVLKEYVARGTYIFPIRHAVRVGCDVVAYCARSAPHWYPMTLCANHMNAAGAGSSNATAFAMANGVCYIRHLLQRGYKIDEIAPLLTMFLDERSDFFTAIANFRASRRIWARLMREQFQAKDSKSMALKITAYSHGGETMYEPINNIARITLAALAYVLGGVQFLFNASYDEVLGTPAESAAKISLRVQQILAHELGISDVADPLGGSYFLETLTSQIENQIYDEFSIIESLGGAIAAIENSYYSSKITDGAVKRKREFDNGERVAIGVNKFRSEWEIPCGAFKIDKTVEATQLERLRNVKKQRNGPLVKETLEYVKTAAQGDGNLVVPILEAVRAYATLGEICGVLREVFGEYQATEYFLRRE
jgi:methylmalonyl-CoA mutase N-terminal domain/subunit